MNDRNLIPLTDIVQLTLTLKMTTAQVVEISATFNYNSPIQDSAHPDNHIPPVYEWILGKTFQYNDNTWQSLTVTVDWLFKLEI